MVLQISLTTSFGQRCIFYQEKQPFCLLPTEQNLQSVSLDVCLWKGSEREENSREEKGRKEGKGQVFSVLWTIFKKR